MQFIIEAIKQSPNHCITFADYMNLVLYHPQEGYYSSGQVKIGSQGDFFTAASLGSDFGELLANQFIEMFDILDGKDTFTLIEVGAGSGILALDILAYLQKHDQNFYDKVNYLIIEEAPGLIEQQKTLLKDLDKVTWKSWEDITDDSIIGCIFSNELIDAFPVHQVVIQNQILKEVYVTLVDNQLQEVIQDLSTPKLLDYFQLIELDFPNNTYPDNYRTEINFKALDLLEIVSNKLKKGYLLTIDYGYNAPKYYHPQRYQGTLKCYYQHRHHHDPYINIGQQDITAHVDFTALEKQGKLLGLETLGLTEQGLFLMTLGLGDRLSELSNGNYTLPEIFKRRDALHQLIDPTGLGGFKVLIQGKNLTEKQKSQTLKGLNQPF
ncbi:class I SAM-dependent methyltransferase [Crocosphaera sp. XPORK-15E]|uniref:class I SAM-dependent methyltransferase n=1 Tax=Crocosphaera sp. XPORK-15E TaxID=3110247 RepID=UPI002B2139EB|nr:class I SAM-dependent methyltransferase [Crocosphaera sp. XPORK-15E]MEA5535790.1 class I SAM-dependent methyltransferase [Crocosphaera sp. XPORK-15E]